MAIRGNNGLGNISLYNVNTPAKSESKDINNAVANILNKLSPDNKVKTLTPLNQNNAFSVTNNAEEMTFLLSESVEKENVEEFNKDEYKTEKKYLNLEAIEEDYTKVSAQEDPKKELEKLTNLVKSQQGNSADVLELVGKWSNDPSEQYLGLAFLIANASNPKEKMLFENARRKLLAKKRKSIFSGLNIIDESVEFAEESVKNGENPREATKKFRSSYRDIIDGKSFSNMFSQSLDRFGEKGFESGVKLLIKGLGSDLKSVRPSVEPEKLKLYLKDMSFLINSISTLDTTRAFTDKFNRFYKNIHLSAIPLLKELASLTAEELIVPYHIQTILDKFINGSEDCKISFLTQISNVIKTMPEKLFVTDNAKINCINTFQEVLDKMILGEENE